MLIDESPHIMTYVSRSVDDYLKVAKRRVYRGKRVNDIIPKYMNHIDVSISRQLQENLYWVIDLYDNGDACIYQKKVVRSDPYEYIILSLDMNFIDQLNWNINMSGFYACEQADYPYYKRDSMDADDFTFGVFSSEEKDYSFWLPYDILKYIHESDS